MQEFIGSGAARATLVSMDQPSLRPLMDLPELTKGQQRMRTATHYSIDQLRGLSNFIENSTRVGSFRRHVQTLQKAADEAGVVLDPGELLEQAALFSREASVDFSMHGASRLMTNMRVLSAFFNAGVQGTDQFVRAIKSDPVGVAKRMSLITGTSVALYAMNRRDPDYKNIPDWEKNAFWHIKRNTLGPAGQLLGDDPDDESDDLWLRFPKPFEPGLLAGSLPERFLEFVDAKDPAMLDESMRDLWGGLMTSFIPTPTAVTPIAEMWMDKSLFTGAPIIGKRLADVDPDYHEGASLLATGIANRMNVGEDDPGNKISPRHVDHLFKGWSGGLIQWGLTDGLDYLGTVAGMGTGEVSDLMPGVRVEKPAKELLERFPGLKGFTSRYPAGSQALDDVFEVADKARVAARTMAHLERSMRVDDYVDYAKEVALTWGLNSTMQDILEAIAELRKQRQDITGAPGVSPQDKRRAIRQLDEAMIQNAQAALEAAKDLGIRPDQPNGPVSLVRRLATLGKGS
jgi:hypothetical protein